MWCFYLRSFTFWQKPYLFPFEKEILHNCTLCISLACNLGTIHESVHTALGGIVHVVKHLLCTILKNLLFFRGDKFTLRRRSKMRGWEARPWANGIRVHLVCFFIGISLREKQAQSLEQKDQWVLLKKERKESVYPVFISSSSIPIGPHIVSLSRVAVHSGRMRWDTGVRQLLDSQIPLVHGTRTTGAERVGAEPGTVAQRKLICLLTDGSPAAHTATSPPACQPRRSGAGWRGRTGGGEDDIYWIWNVDQLEWTCHPGKEKLAGMVLPPVTYSSVCDALVCRRRPAAVGLGKHICAAQGMNVTNLHQPDGSFITITSPGI